MITYYVLKTSFLVKEASQQ